MQKYEWNDAVASGLSTNLSAVLPLPFGLGPQNLGPEPNTGNDTQPTAPFTRIL
ncbi:MAG: hypothetical protein HONBIEJF_01086 [Fimbriimonadaceae bacterium]|nr:hypothetical protein [Fimbriimonadaceae bacterium]